MNIPGFTAEASLYNGGVHYQATSEASFYGGLVQPAHSDVYVPRDPPRLTPDRSTYHPRPLFCLKPINLTPWEPTPMYLWKIGIWNPLTGFCEIVA